MGIIIVSGVIGAGVGVFIGWALSLRRQNKEYHKLFNSLAAAHGDLKGEVNALTTRVAILEMGVDEDELEERQRRLYYERV